MVKNIIVGAVILVGAIFGLLGDDEPSDNPPAVPSVSTTSYANVSFNDSYGANDTWLVYWYVCGSNLETDYGSASSDIQEMMNATIPDNVKVLIEAGGAKEWKNAFMTPDRLNRCLYDSTGIHVLDPAPLADMGSPDTVASFLRYGEDNFKADHKVFIFWDHGGGSLFGVCHDELSEGFLSLNEIRDAFTSVYDANENNPPFEVVGFDTCLMATYENVNNFHGLARYMVASEEVEPGNGWEYTGLLSALGSNPAMGGDALGKVICDTYYSGCQDNSTEDNATLSVIDLSKVPQLRTAYENFGIEALQLSTKNPKKFFSQLGRNAKSSENYGGNNFFNGYYDMIDVCNLAQTSKDLIPVSSQNLISAVDNAVVYKINGEYRDKGAGISGFYPYDGDTDTLEIYNGVYAAPQSHKYLYHYLMNGSMPEEAKPLLDVDVSQLIQTSGGESFFDISDLEDWKIQLDKDNNAFVQLTADQMDNLSSVRCNLAYVDPDSDVVVYLGNDVTVDIDWDKGIVKDQFDGTWLMLDGNPVYVEVAAEEEDYDLYSIPIKLNGQRCSLEIAYDYGKKEYKVLGARPLNSNRGVSNKQLIKVQKGDRITTLHYGMTISGDDSDFTEVEVDTFTVGDELKFEEERLDDGEYIYCFEFVTPDNESATSEFVNFTIQGNDIFTTQLEN